MEKNALSPHLLFLGALLVGFGLVTACSDLFSPTPTQPPFSADEVNACRIDNECVLVQAGPCGGAEAINQVHSQRWEQYLEQLRKEIMKNPIACGPSLPLDQFEPLCLNRQCAAVYIWQHGLLAFGADPLVGQTVPLRFSLVYASDTPGVQATILLPDGIEKVSGDLAWQGNLSDGQEQTIEAQVKVTHPGCYVVRAKSVPKALGVYQSFEPAIYLKATETEASLRRQPEAYWDMRYALPVPENAESVHSQLTFEPIPGETGRYRLAYSVISEADMFGAARSDLTLLLPNDAFSIEEVHHPSAGEIFNDDTQVTWRGPIPANQTVELALSLKLIQPGYGPVIGMLQVDPGGSVQSRITDTVVKEVYLCE